MGEFLEQPGDTFQDFHELLSGEVVEMPSPTLDHVLLQARLETLLRTLSPAGDQAFREFYFTLPTEAQRVDVATVSTGRLNEQGSKVFFGSPELVVEVLSPSNLHMDVDHLREECFKAGCLEFWVIDRELQTITVHRRSPDCPSVRSWLGSSGGSI